ncbi:MAG: AsmA family protein, partial [Pseudomonadota bacterium]
MRWLIRIIGTFVVLAALLVGALLLVPAERFAGLAADRFQEATGRALSIDGEVRATLWPQFGIRAGNVTVANPDWAGAAPLLQAGSVEIGLPLSAFWGDEVRIDSLVLMDAIITLVRDAGGSESWDFAPGPSDGIANAAPSANAPSAVPIAVAFAELQGAEITYQDRATGTAWQMRAVDLEARLPDPMGALGLTGSALIGGQAVALDAQVGQLADLLAGTLAPFTATFSAGGTTLVLDGRADLAPAAYEGRLDMTSTDRFAAFQTFGFAPPDLPDGLGSQRVALSAALTLAPAGTIHLRDMTATLDGNRLTGALDIDPSGDRPKITASLSADSLDMTGMSREGQGGETALVAETGWGQEEIDVSGLFAIDAAVTLATGPITLGDATLDSLNAAISVDQGRAVMTLQPLVAYGGTVTGDIVLNGRGGLSARATLDLAGLQMQPFLTEFADWDRLIGQADATIRLLGVGNT